MHLILLIMLCLTSLFFDLLKVNNKKKYKVIFMGIWIFLFAALRSQKVGVDVASYFDDFLLDSKMSFQELFSYRKGRDPVFHLLLKILSYISSNPQIMLIVVGAIVAICFSYLVYHLPGDPLLIFILFICFRLYSFTLSGLRQAIAMSLTWVAFVCYLKNKNLLFFIVTLFASLFHVSAIIFIFVFLLFKIKKTNYVLIASILSLILYFILGNQVIQNILNFILPGRFDGYIDRAEQSTFDVSIVTISLVLMLVLSMIFYNNFKSIKRNKIITCCMNLAIIGITFFIIGDSFPNMFRISYYFLIFLFPVFAEILNIVLEKKTYQIAYVALVLLLGFEYIYGGTGAGTEIYRFFWQ